MSLMLVLLLSLLGLSEAIVCYAPDGTTASPDFQPCIAVDGVESSTSKKTNTKFYPSNTFPKCAAGLLATLISMSANPMVFVSTPAKIVSSAISAQVCSSQMLPLAKVSYESFARNICVLVEYMSMGALSLRRCINTQLHYK